MAFDSSTESTLRLIEMAGSQRLPADIRRLEIHDESSILHTMELAVQAYIKTIPLKELHDKKKSQEVYKEVITILNKFEFITKDAFQSAWTILLCQDMHSESDPKKILEIFASIACNRILKNYITMNLLLFQSWVVLIYLLKPQMALLLTNVMVFFITEILD